MGYRACPVSCLSGAEPRNHFQVFAMRDFGATDVSIRGPAIPEGNVTPFWEKELPVWTGPQECRVLRRHNQASPAAGKKSEDQPGRIEDTLDKCIRRATLLYIVLTAPKIFLLPPLLNPLSLLSRHFKGLSEHKLASHISLASIRWTGGRLQRARRCGRAPAMRAACLREHAEMPLNSFTTRPLSLSNSTLSS